MTRLRRRRGRSAEAPRDSIGALLDTVRRCTAPLLVWALFFAFSYGAIAVGCVAGRGGQVKAVLAGATAIALTTTLLMGWHAFGRSPARGATRTRPSLTTMAARLCATLAFVAIAWSAVPLARLAACGP